MKKAYATSRSSSVAVLGLALLTGTPSTLAFQSSSRISWRHSQRPTTPSLVVSSSPTIQSSSNNSPTQLALWNEALTSIDTFYQTAPYAAGALTCGAKASAADFVAQKRSQQAAEQEEGAFETARNVAFLIYGAMYQGVAQEFIYNHCYAAWFGVESTPFIVMQKVLFDLCIQTTLVTLPMAYLTKAAIFRYSFREGLRRYKNDVLKNGLLKKYFMIWGPVQCLTFSIVPEHLRITFIAAVSFFWLIILSTISGVKQDAVAPPPPMSAMESDEIVFCETKELMALVNNATTVETV